MSDITAERHRQLEADAGHEPWAKWGPYVSDRQWGTVREDYSADGNAWGYFPFSHAHRRAYRWGEDGLAAVCDSGQRLCLGLALWNGADPILKERLFGLANEEGNHGEDVKEVYYHLDATPTHSYLKFLYKYPQRAFPYGPLYDGGKRSRHEREYELTDTDAFEGDRYFDVIVEYAKAAPSDLLMLVTVHNRGPEAATCHVLPQLWFRNTWAWGDGGEKPAMHREGAAVRAAHPEWDDYLLHYADTPELLFTANETNAPALFDDHSNSGFYKDAFTESVVHGNRGAVNAACTGTKVAGHYTLVIPAGGSAVVRVRLRFIAEPAMADPFADFDAVIASRRQEADAYYALFQENVPDADARLVQRQALAGLIWSKQFYLYDVWRWRHGDPGRPAPPKSRMQPGRNGDWEHLKMSAVVSMPDKWEYPWFAAWDSAFHAVPFAVIDGEFAKDQLRLFLNETVQHPNGQLPAYEWNFGDANPPVHAWACWRVYQIDRKMTGVADRSFLEGVFHKLMLNFTWWVNRKDADGRNVFQGGFLGLDNIGVFDRSQPLPMGGTMSQADATGWMAMYSLNLMRIALELAIENSVYQAMAIKFFEHFLSIASAMTNMGGRNIGLWDAADSFYYDELTLPDGRIIPLKVRSLVGLIPLFAVEVLEPELLAQVPEFANHMRNTLDARPDLAALVSRWYEPGRGESRLLSLLRGHRMKKLLNRMLDPGEFLSEYGIRSLSKFHGEHPYQFRVGDDVLTVDYQPGESTIGTFGGNSNWRGPVWLPMNYLIIESLQKFHHYYGDEFQIECPTGSGKTGTIIDAAREISKRVTRLFLKDANGRRAALGDDDKLQFDTQFQNCVPFHEYFDGENGRGLGASHQTGWTALVAKLLWPMGTTFKGLSE